MPSSKATRKFKKAWNRRVDNKMRAYGETNYKKRTIRVNKKKSKKTRELLDSIIHEELHARHPRMHERTVRGRARTKAKRMSAKSKRRMYALYA